MFEDIIENKKKNTVDTLTAILEIDDKNYVVEIYDVEMTAGSITGFINNGGATTINNYTHCRISIPSSSNWSFPIVIERVNSKTLKFYVPEVK